VAVSLRLAFPQLQEGSSIMPDKINPVITEMATEVAYQIMSLDQAITLASFSGQLELNAFLPLITFNLLTGLKLLINGTTVFRPTVSRGLKQTQKTVASGSKTVYALRRPLHPTLVMRGLANSLKRHAWKGKTVREAAIEEGLFLLRTNWTAYSRRRNLRDPVLRDQKTVKRKKEK